MLATREYINFGFRLFWLSTAAADGMLWVLGMLALVERLLLVLGGLVT